MRSGWLAGDWPAGDGVLATCSTRTGGVSNAPYDSLNLGDHVNDDPAAVAANRRRYAEALGARPVFLRQVHGTGIVPLSAATPDGTEADACWTRERGIACTILVADCMPVLLADARDGIVGAAHCGWRGLAGGVLPNVLQAMGVGDGVRLRAWLGPCIGPQRFEVGEDVLAAFTKDDADAVRFFRPHAQGKFLADLPALARRQLAGLGITQVEGNDGSDAWCTVTQGSRFFSHRRDRVSGRFAASIWLA
ncbi:peptidoglycan editing factor PgeF [Ramlibacter sp. CrO1]|uniref:Purine nucleoside phosphorylase n=1 Tax=Ramlibacter algicola TaxID=2795217 RepID=A0A934URF0_9BURK|nr:peptidoglycan editing factor PgeF [Ramlibacter algicola]MBK0393115.1 peptidoglycan editing factor PgeF [Ramlibacter algicola]